MLNSLASLEHDAIRFVIALTMYPPVAGMVNRTSEIMECPTYEHPTVTEYARQYFGMPVTEWKLCHEHDDGLQESRADGSTGMVGAAVIMGAGATGSHRHE